MHTFIHTFVILPLFFLRQLEEECVRKCQKIWTQRNKGSITKEYFPDIEGRIKMEIIRIRNLTTILTGHGNIKAYLHSFHMSEEERRPCGEEDKTTDHIMYEYEILKEERDKLRTAVNKTEDWPISKRNLLKRHYKEFLKFIISIPFEELKSEG